MPQLVLEQHIPLEQSLSLLHRHFAPLPQDESMSDKEFVRYFSILFGQMYNEEGCFAIFKHNASSVEDYSLQEDERVIFNSNFDEISCVQKPFCRYADVNSPGWWDSDLRNIEEKALSQAEGCSFADERPFHVYTPYLANGHWYLVAMRIEKIDKNWRIQNTVICDPLNSATLDLVQRRIRPCLGTGHQYLATRDCGVYIQEFILNCLKQGFVDGMRSIVDPNHGKLFNHDAADEAGAGILPSSHVTPMELRQRFHRERSQRYEQLTRELGVSFHPERSDRRQQPVVQCVSNDVMQIGAINDGQRNINMSFNERVASIEAKYLGSTFKGDDGSLYYVNEKGERKILTEKGFFGRYQKRVLDANGNEVAWKAYHSLSKTASKYNEDEIRNKADQIRYASDVHYDGKIRQQRISDDFLPKVRSGRIRAR